MEYKDAFSYNNPKEISPQQALRELLAKDSLTPEEQITKEYLLFLKGQYDESDVRLLRLNEKFPRKGKGTYYDFEGNPISMWDWSELHTYHKYIAFTCTNGFRISTVYLGMDQGYSFGVKDDEPYFPLIFETMIFIEEKYNEGSGLKDYQERYAFEEQALEGHIRAINLVMNYV